jgi:hypothetical protein
MSQVKSVVPFSLQPENLTSGSEYIVRRRVNDIPANESTSFGSTPSVYQTQFNIGSSGVEYLDGMNSFIRCKLTVATGTADVLVNTVRAFLDEGGIHSLIKTLTIQLRNGTRVEHIENYNKVYAMISNLRHNAQHIDSVEAAQSGDSMAYKPYLDPYKVHAWNANLVPDDSKNGVYRASQLIPITDNLANDLTLAEITNEFKAWAAAPNLIDPARRKMANTTQHDVTFKPMSNFLMHSKYIPLPFLQQLQIKIEWERSNIGLFLDKYTAAGAALQNTADTDTLNYTISQPVYVANLVEPSPAITSMMEKAFMSSGIQLSFLGYKTFKKIETGAAVNMEVSANFRSARFVLAAVMEDEAFTEGNASKAYPSNSTYRKSGMTDWIFKSGGMRFPENGPIDTRTIYSAETFTNALIAVNSHGSTLHDTRIRQWEWQSDYEKKYSGAAAVKTIADSTKFIIGAPLCRGDAFTGADLTNNSLFFEANFDNGAGANTYFANKNILSVIGYDAVLSISRESGSIIRF